MAGNSIEDALVRLQDAAGLLPESEQPTFHGPTMLHMRAGIRQAFFHPIFIAVSRWRAKVRLINPEAD